MAINMRLATCSLLALLLTASAGGVSAADRKLQDTTVTITVTPTTAIQEAESLIAEAEGFAKTAVENAYTILNRTEGNATMQEIVELVVSCNATGYDLLQIGQEALAKGEAELDQASLDLYTKVQQLLDSIRTIGPALLQKGKDELAIGAQLVQNASELVNTTGNALVQQGADLVQGAKELLNGADHITILGQDFDANDVYSQISDQLIKLGQELNFVGAQVNAGAQTTIGGRKLQQSATSPGDQFAALGKQLVAYGAQLAAKYHPKTAAPTAAPSAAPTASG